LIAAGANVSESPGAVVVGTDSLSVYVETSGFLAWVAVIVGVLVLTASPLARRFMHEDDAT